LIPERLFCPVELMRPGAVREHTDTIERQHQRLIEFPNHVSRVLESKEIPPATRVGFKLAANSIPILFRKIRA